MKPLMFTITGPSCAGKTTLLNVLVERFPEVFCKLTSVTTRPPRPGEVEGDEYFFVSEEEFQKDMNRGHFAQTVHYGGVYYGTPWAQLTGAFESGLVPIRVVEPTGVEQFRQACKEIGGDVVSIFAVEAAPVLIRRWLERFRATALPDLDYFAKRIALTVEVESDWINQKDYDFYFDPYGQNEESMVYTLSRIGQRKIPAYRVKHLTQKSA